MIRRNIYRWHRICSLIIAVPVLLWAVSGFLHPIMTNVRPKLATQALPQVAVDSSHIKVTVQEALLRNRVDSIYSVRLVHIDTNWFYQVKTTRDEELQYYSTLNGKQLKKGDWLYAQYIARQFLEGAPAPSVPSAAAAEPGAAHDCCDAAASCVLYTTKGAGVADVSVVNAFDGEYKSINRLLPVYKVSFHREDGVRVYVETGQSRFAAAIDNRRAAFTRFFTLVHTFGWLDMLSNGRLWVEILFTVLAFATTVMGIYIFCITKTKRGKGNGVSRARVYHRITGIVASLFTLGFTFSGAWHAFSRVNEVPDEVHTVLTPIATTAVQGSFAALQQQARGQVVNIGLVQQRDGLYWQVYQAAAGGKSGAPKDLMKAMKVEAPRVAYVSVAGLVLLQKGEEQYARYLAQGFTGYAPADVVSVTQVTHFTEEYNFADKRLPVWRIAYRSGERVYVETASGVMAKLLTDAELYEDYSFALLHKHHFMDFAGKQWRDGSTLLGAGMQIVMVAIGLLFYFRLKKQ